MQCGSLGAESNHLRDRVFMVTRPNGDYVSSKNYPKMLLISPQIVGDGLTLSAPDMLDLKINIAQLYNSNNTVIGKISKDRAACVDCGEDSAKWLSQFILGENEGVRLIFYPSKSPKPEVADKKYLGYFFKQADLIDTGALHYHTSYMLMNQGSFEDLNTKLDQAVGPLQYRPNFVVDGPSAWEEDSWKWIKIGDKTIFKSAQPCIRCSSTIINPTTAERNPESMKTLKSFRTFKEVARGPWFGIHLGIRAKGNVKLGDDVYVGE